jgi:hypothetical protein
VKPGKRSFTGLRSCRRHGGCVAAAVIAIGALSVVTNTAAAASYQRPYKEVLGQAAQPSFENPGVLVVDPNTGDILVGDIATESISRFHADGSPAPFSALGTNVIDGREGPDETPQGEHGERLELRGQQLAIDGSSGPTSGDIYLTQGNYFGAPEVVDIFDSDGRYIGNLSGTSAGALEQVGGVTVDADGAVYVGTRIAGAHAIAKYVPSTQPVENTDNTSTFALPSGPQGVNEVGQIAAGMGSSAGWLFITTARSGGAEAFKVSENTGATFPFSAGFGGLVTVAPDTGNPIFGAGGPGSTPETALEFLGSLESGSNPASKLVSQQGEMRAIAAGASGEVYVVARGNEQIFVYGAPGVVPTANAEAASDVTGTAAILNAQVNPSGLPVTTCAFQWGPTAEYGSEAPCEGAIPTDSSSHPVHLKVSGLNPDGTTYHFRVAVTNENGTEVSADQTLVTAQRVVTAEATAISAHGAVLSGVLRPEGEEVTECFFEWELANQSGYQHTVSCAPSVPDIPSAFTPQTVTAAIGALEEGAAYRFRLVAATAPVEGRRRGEAMTFTTYGAPRIREVRALNATQTTAVIEAKVDPEGFSTTYRFEWGPTESYGHLIPIEFEPNIGSGTSAIDVSGRLAGLEPGKAYHYRVAATNAANGRSVTVSPDHELETLNDCALPEGRCLEMVSPRSLSPVSGPGRVTEANGLQAQAGEQAGVLAYTIDAGLEDAPKGAEVLYRAGRSPGEGWMSTLLTPPTTVRNEHGGQSADPSLFDALSKNLSCGVITSAQPLTNDPVAELIRTAGGSNLYRYDASAALPYSLITNLPPDTLSSNGGLAAEFRLRGMSRNCSTILFSTPHHYAGVPGVGDGERLYEWREGAGLNFLGSVPGVSGEQLTEAWVSGENVEGIGAAVNGKNAVSSDGSRVFFMARNLIPGNPEDPGEAGALGVFVREQGQATRNLSASETTVPDEGAMFEGASPDGSRAYFVANAGLTAHSSPEGTDLYEYDFETSTLNDLTVSEADGGAAVAAVVGISADGSHVYFTSRDQLVPGRGDTRSKNEDANSYSLYDAAEGEISFVATVSDLQAARPSESVARVSGDGRYLLFESIGSVTGNEAGEHGQAYLYDADDPAEPLVCVSCRQDGGTSVNTPPAADGRAHCNSEHGQPLVCGGQTNPLDEPRSLVVSATGPEVFFVSRDDLAEGAVEGTWNLYEWVHAQVYLIASEPSGYASPSRAGEIRFGGASSDGTDLYFFDAATLNWENPEGRSATWDARVGGGFAEPAPPATPCDPRVEGSCQAMAAPLSGAPAAGTENVSGSGNVKSQPSPPRKKAKLRKKHRKHHHHATKRHARSVRRNLNQNRRAVK